MKSTDPIAAVRTPYKFDRPMLTATFHAGDFDSHAVDTPFLFRHEGRYRMLYGSFDGIGYRTGLASSDDLVTWQREGLVHDRGPAGSPTAFNVAINGLLRDVALMGPGDATVVDGRLLGVWHGYPERGQEQGRGYTGLARGDSLRRWTVEPPFLTAADGAAWERGGLYKPCLIRHDGRYFVFYNAKNTLEWPWHEQIGVAWSDDLRHWTRYEGNPIVPNGGPGSPDEIFAADPCILQHGQTWVMFYYGLAADGHARELAAFSDDLLTWRKADRVLIDVGADGSLDAMHAHKPGVIAADGVLYHYYGAARRWQDVDGSDVVHWNRRCVALATSRPLG